LKGVRLTMPCVTGPYTNVGATLRLTGSSIRLTAPGNQVDPLDGTTQTPADAPRVVRDYDPVSYYPGVS
jgi:hypothetical protein